MGWWRVGRKLNLNEEVRDRIDDIKTPSVNRGVVNLSITTDASALFPAFDSQVVKEIVGVRGAKYEETKGTASLGAGVCKFNRVKVIKQRW